jgi:hypothetical protein
MSTSKTEYLIGVNFSKSWIEEGKGKEIIPSDMRAIFADTPVSAERW